MNYNAPRYRIKAKLVDGQVIDCFTWTRAPEAGVATARAAIAGMPNLAIATEVWAEEVK